MLDELRVPRTQRAQVAVEKARQKVTHNIDMIGQLLQDLPEHKDRHVSESISLDNFHFDGPGENVVDQKIRTDNRFVTFFRDMLKQ